MTEQSARLILTISGATATVSFIIAMFLALRGDQLLGAIFLGIALMDVAAAFFAYRQYTRLRGDRWRSELREGEDEISRLLTGAEQDAKSKPGPERDA